MNETEDKNAAGRAFGLIVIFAMAIQAVVTAVWGFTGRPNLALPTPILSLIFLVLLMLGLVVGVKAVAHMRIEPFIEYEDQEEKEEEEE